MLLYIDEAGDDVGINEMPEPMPKFRAVNESEQILILVTSLLKDDRPHFDSAIAEHDLLN